MKPVPAVLVLEDGSRFECFSFGAPHSCSGEVVFNTGMVGYPESFTDPSYRGQILTLTYPLIGNYGVPSESVEDNALRSLFESNEIHISGLVVSEYCKSPSHWNSQLALREWLKKYKIPAVYGVDTRALTKKLREHGVMLGKILLWEEVEKESTEFEDPNTRNLVAEVSIEKPILYESPKAKKTIALVDCGAKNNIIRSLLARNVNVLRVPWDYDLFNSSEKFDAVFLSNGPGDPKQCTATIETAKKSMESKLPTLGICLGNQILSLAAGADTYKLKYGHRSQNQPCVMQGTKKCFITSQNHGFAVDEETLPKGWEPWFTNLNDKTNEGIRHKKKPFMSVQFHPEATPGPVDANFLFDKFLEMVK